MSAEREVRAVEAAYDAAWAAGDVDALMVCFTRDAVVRNPRGETASGLEEIAAALGGFLSGEAAGTTHASNVTSVRFVTADVAIVDGDATIVGFRDGTTVRHRFTDVLVRSDGRWAIADVRAYGE